MSKRYDLVGQKFGRLTVKSKGEVVKQKTIWHCKCECGNDVVTTTGSLNAGLVQSCGCMWKDNARKIGKARFIDLTGKKFERLTVIRLIKKSKSYILWECECECGKTANVRGNDLRTSNTRSCGCLNVEAMREEGKKNVGAILETMVENTNIAILNDKPTKRNKSGVKGVFWNKARGKWEARIGFQGKVYKLGVYEFIDDAAKARKEAEEQLFNPILEKYGKDTL